MLSMFDLSGKTALVTGAGVGLGFGMAEGLAEAGANISAVGLEPLPAIEKRAAELGRKYLFTQADLIGQSQIPTIVERTVETFGSIDILVNNAGIIRRQDMLDFTEKDWDDVININLKTVFMLSQACARQMAKQGGGKIISVASMLSFQGGIRVPSYTASKSGVAGLTKLMANELAKFNIQANAVAPGYMATDNTAALRKDEKRSREILDRIPADRWGTPEDLKGAVVFLASKASDYVTGHILAIDGGWLAR